MIPIQDFPYYGVEDGDSCYCGANADKLVPANPEECDTPCTGNDPEAEIDETCGGKYYRMNAYGPTFRAIMPNLLIFKHETIFNWYEISIDLKLDGNESDEKQNIFGFQVEGTNWPEVGSQVPAVYINSDDSLNVCFEFNGETRCDDTSVVTLDTWFNLWIEQWCWYDPLDTSIFNCGIWVWIDDDLEFFHRNDFPLTLVNVDGYIGNTYGGEFEAAHGSFKNFELNPYETRDAPSDKLAGAVDVANIDLSGAANAK